MPDVAQYVYSAASAAATSDSLVAESSRPNAGSSPLASVSAAGSRTVVAVAVARSHIHADRSPVAARGVRRRARRATQAGRRIECLTCAYMPNTSVRRDHLRICGPSHHCGAVEVADLGALPVGQSLASQPCRARCAERPSHSAPSMSASDRPAPLIAPAPVDETLREVAMARGRGRLGPRGDVRPCPRDAETRRSCSSHRSRTSSKRGAVRQRRGGAPRIRCRCSHPDRP